MTPLIASFLIRTIGPSTFFSFVLVLLAAGIVMLVAICWDIVRAWIKRTRSRNWLKVSAVVDIVSVAVCANTLPGRGEPPYYYDAQLTYVYQTPEQQMGFYSRTFGNEDDAKAWANSYKGETVQVHVDPRDPSVPCC